MSAFSGPAVPVSAVILTRNEERNLVACLESLSGWTDQVFVVDSGSSDRTVEIARAAGASVVTKPFDTHAKQWNWALRNLPLRGEWALCLDADHRVTPELRDEIRSRFAKPDGLSAVDGFYVRRKQVFRGRWIRHGGYYPKHLLKLVRHRLASCDEAERLDFRFYVPGRTETFRHDLVEDNQNETDISFWLMKHVRFARLQAEEEALRRANGSQWRSQPALVGTPDQRTLWLKRLWYGLPLYMRPFGYFFYRYVVRLGFLDGKQGFIFHLLQAFWYRLVVDIMIDDRRSGR